MKVGIGLPTMVPSRPGTSVASWAVAAEHHGFSTLAVNDNMVNDSFEPFIALAAAAAVTTDIRLTTAVVLAPLHSNVALLARQAATLDVISDGRLTLGVGIGPRRADYDVSGVDFHRRGRLLDEQLDALFTLWNGSHGEARLRPVQPGGPEILIGASSPAGIERLARHGAGYIAGYGPLERFRANAALADQAWSDGARSGVLRKLALRHFALGDGAEHSVESFISAGEFGPHAARVRDAVVMTPRRVGELLEKYAEAGCDELVFTPCDASVRQIDLLAECVDSAYRITGPSLRQSLA